VFQKKPHTTEQRLLLAEVRTAQDRVEAANADLLRAILAAWRAGIPLAAIGRTAGIGGCHSNPITWASRRRDDAITKERLRAAI
jgi:hypothetical protein